MYMITLKDIAKEAGVSMMTVSRVINGNTSKVSEKTAEMVKEIVKKRGYIPNSSARTLAAKSSKTIALLLLSSENTNPLEDTYNAAFLGEIARYIQEKGYFLILRYVTDYNDITFSLQSWNVEGAIFIGMFDQSIRAIQSSNQIPLIFTDSYSLVRQITNVGLDDYKGGKLAAEYFLEMGHTSLAFIGPAFDSDGVVSQRFFGFKETLETHGITLPKEYVFTSGTMPSSSMHPELIEQLLALKGKVTGIFATADQIAFSVMEGLKNSGLHLPEDFSIIGFDDFPLSRQIEPPLTTIHQDIVKKAKLASDLLFKHIEEPNAPAENITLDVSLIERCSVKKLK